MTITITINSNDKVKVIFNGVPIDPNDKRFEEYMDIDEKVRKLQDRQDELAKEIVGTKTSSNKGIRVKEQSQKEFDEGFDEYLKNL